MGRELKTTVRFGADTRVDATVHLDTASVQVSGRPRIEVRFSEVERVLVRGSLLSLSTARGVLEVHAGDQAEAWAERIRNPPSRAKKLGLVAGTRVALEGLSDPTLLTELEAADAELVAADAAADVIFLGVGAPGELALLPALAKRLPPQGALWVVRSKGRAATVSEAAVRSAARAAGLVDVKVVAFSDSQSADKFVIPVSARTATPAARRPAKKRAAAATSGEKARGKKKRTAQAKPPR